MTSQDPGSNAKEQLVSEDKSIPTVSAAGEAQRNSLQTEIITLQQQLFNSFLANKLLLFSCFGMA